MVSHQNSITYKLAAVAFFVFVTVFGVLFENNLQPVTAEFLPIGDRERNSASNDPAVLGKLLFFDKRLSADGTVSCAVCHDPATAFAGGTAFPVGVNGRIGTRNTPTLLNSGRSKSYFWDGRAVSLEEQIMHPLLNPSEMGMKSGDFVVVNVSSRPEYKDKFRRVFGSDKITSQMIASAIAAYERTLVSDDAPFDRFLDGEQAALTDSQKRGWQLFRNKADCIACHFVEGQAPLFTDFKFHNTGIALSDETLKLTIENMKNPETNRLNPDKTTTGDFLTAPNSPDSGQFADLGRFTVSRREQDIGAFKTPTLRNAELTSPYMHDGSLKTLLDVVRFYNRGGAPNRYLDGKMRPLDLSEREMSDLVEFLRALTGENALRLAQSSIPQTRTYRTRDN